MLTWQWRVTLLKNTLLYDIDVSEFHILCCEFKEVRFNNRLKSKINVFAEFGCIKMSSALVRQALAFVEGEGLLYIYSKYKYVTW